MSSDNKENIEGKINVEPVVGEHHSEKSISFFTECEDGSLFDKYKELSEYNLKKEDEELLVEAVVAFLNGKVDIEGGNTVDDYSDTLSTDLQDSKFIEMIIDRYMEINGKKTLYEPITHKTNPFTFRAMVVSTPVKRTTKKAEEKIIPVINDEEEVPSEYRLKSQPIAGGGLTDIMKPYTRVRNQMIRLRKAEIRKNIYRKLLAKDGNHLLPHVEHSDDCYYLGRGHLNTFSESAYKNIEKQSNTILSKRDKIMDTVKARGLKDDDSHVYKYFKYSLEYFTRNKLFTPFASIILFIRNFLEENNETLYKTALASLTKKDENTDSFTNKLKKASKYTDISRIVSAPYFGLITPALQYFHNSELKMIQEIIKQDQSRAPHYRDKSRVKLNTYFLYNKWVELLYYIFTTGLASVSLYGIFRAPASLAKIGLKSVFGKKTVSRITRKGGKTKKNRGGSLYAATQMSGAGTSGTGLVILIILVILFLSSGGDF